MLITQTTTKTKTCVCASIFRREILIYAADLAVKLVVGTTLFNFIHCKRLFKSCIIIRLCIILSFKVFLEVKRNSAKYIFLFASFGH